MATSFKRLGSGNIQTANSQTTVYTVPTGNKAIVKSFILSNGSASSVTVIVRFAALEILFNYIMKPYDTIVVPVMDQCLFPSHTITVYASSATVSYYISGIETLTGDPEYLDITRLGYGILPANSSALFSATSKDRLVKGIILCNTNSADTRVSMDVSGWKLLQGFLIKGYETILVPTADLLLESQSTILGSGSGVNYYITGKEL
ncbi:hypothetical protein [Paenibacillus pabuli]|uniref:hypothetical protein n=1 Tax=Paenibacillus pabuli TaxID=1472 RepID=UPI001FFEA016|nr:hypothetical protein [Paenibacillus pabuli]UPK45208.1 hypothetical protein KET34_06855 [Paenibacillus pabuli]